MENFRAPRTHAKLDDVASIVAHHHVVEMRVILSCSKLYYNDNRLLRVVISNSERPQLLASALRGKARRVRIDQLLTQHSAEQLNMPLHDGRTVLERCVHNPSPDNVRLISTIEGVHVPDDMFPSIVRPVAAQRLYSTGEPKVDCHAAAEACAEAIASSNLCDPSAISSGGRSNLSLAAEAGLVDVVRRWLQDARCTAELLKRQDDDGHTPFTRVCDTVIKLHDKNSDVDVMKRLIYCAKLLAWDSRNSPAWTGPRDNTQLGYAAALRMADVLRPWIKDSRVTVAVLETPFVYSIARVLDGPFSLFELASTRWCPLGPEEGDRHISPGQLHTLGLHDAATCMSILAMHPDCSPAFAVDDETSNMRVACAEGAVDVITRWVKDPRCTAEALQEVGEQDAWAVVCCKAAGAKDEQHRAAYLRILELFIDHPAIDPTSTVLNSDEQHTSYLAYACTAGAINIVKRMLADPRCPKINDTVQRPLRVVYLLGDSDIIKRFDVWTSIRECVRLTARHPSCRPLGKYTANYIIEQTNMWYACKVGLADVVLDRTRLGGPTGAEYLQDCTMKEGTAFGAVCHSISQIEAVRPDAGVLDEYRSCAGLLAVRSACLPNRRAQEDASYMYLSQSNMEAACAAGLVDIVAEWLPMWDATEDAQAGGHGP